MHAYFGTESKYPSIVFLSIYLAHSAFEYMLQTWAKVVRTIPEFRILRLTFHRKSASKC